MVNLPGVDLKEKMKMNHDCWLCHVCNRARELRVDDAASCYIRPMVMCCGCLDCLTSSVSRCVSRALLGVSPNETGQMIDQVYISLFSHCSSARVGTVSTTGCFPEPDLFWAIPKPVATNPSGVQPHSEVHWLGFWVFLGTFNTSTGACLFIYFKFDVINPINRSSFHLFAVVHQTSFECQTLCLQVESRIPSIALDCPWLLPSQLTKVKWRSL